LHDVFDDDPRRRRHRCHHAEIHVLPLPLRSPSHLTVLSDQNIARRGGPARPYGCAAPPRRAMMAWVTDGRSAPALMSGCELGSESEFAGDEHELDLGGAFADLEDLRVAVVAGDEVFVHEAVAAVDLGGVASIVHGCFAGDHLRNGGFLL